MIKKKRLYSTVALAIHADADEVRETLETFLTVVSDQLAAGHEVQLKHFGRLTPKLDGTVHFNPCRYLRERVAHDPVDLFGFADLLAERA